MLAQGIDKILPVAILLYLARSLGAEEFGSYSFVIAYLAFFQIAAEYSLDTVLVRTMSQRPVERVAIFQAGLGLKVATALLAAVLSCVLVGAVSGGQTPLGLMILASLSLVTGMGAAYRSLFRSTLEIRWVFAIALVRAALLASAVVVAVAVAPGLHAIFAAMAIANVCAFVAIAVAASSRVRPAVMVDRALWGELIRGALPLAGNAFALTVSLRAGQLLLMSMRGPVEVGLLSAASRVTEAFTFLPEALMISVYPLMAGLAPSDALRLRQAAQNSSRYLVAAAGFPVILCLAAGREIMVLLYGDGFSQAGPVLSLLSVMALLSATGTVIMNLLIAAHRERTLYRNTMAFAVANVLLCLLLIPESGYAGAALAMVVTSATSQLALALLPATRDFVRPCLRSALGGFAAVGLAYVATLYPALGLPSRLMAGVAVYLAALFVFRVIDRTELLRLGYAEMFHSGSQPDE